MKFKQTPVLTSQNYGINYVEINDGYFNFSKQANFDVNISNDQFCEITDIENKDISINSVTDTLSQQYNHSKKIVVKDNSNTPIFIEINNQKNCSLATKLEIEICSQISTKMIIKMNNIETLSQITSIEFLLNRNSNLDLVVLSDNSNSGAVVNDLKFNLKENANANINLVNFSPKNLVDYTNVNLLEANSKAVLNSLCFGSNDDALNMNHAINVFGKNCNAKINSLNVLGGRSQKNYVGTINFEKGSSKSVGDESESSILLTNQAKAKSTPILLSKEDDAIGKHSASVHNIDAKKLFYVSTRGLSKLDATKIFVSAKLNSFTKNIFDENIKDEINKKIEMRLNNENEWRD